MKVSVVISLCDNRDDLFKRSLDTWNKQNFPKEDFELVLIDDAEREDIFELCKYYNMNFQFIRIDNSKCDVPIKTFIPVLSNNVGFRQSRGSVIVITGPETLQNENNLKVAYELSDRAECAYGTVYLSDEGFTDIISKNWHKIKKYPFKELISIKGANVDCLTVPPHPPAYWFLTVVKKEHIFNINGIDEKFAQGICGEDDDFANRMNFSNIKPVFNYNLLGIHQNHSQIDKSTKKHSERYKAEGKLLRQKNIQLMNYNKSKKIVKVNLNHTWGDPKVITNHRYLGVK